MTSDYVFPSLNMSPEARAVGPEGVHQLVDRRTHPPRTGRQRVDGDLIVTRNGHRDSRTSHGNQNRAAMGEGVGGDRSRAAIHCAKALCGQPRPSPNEEPRPTFDHPPPRLQSYLRFSTRVSDTRQGSYERLRLKIAIAQVLSESNPCREVLYS